jgi:DNA-binding transcriptional LysR family regulator
VKSQIDLHRIRLTIEVARRHSISAAARSLGISQPALTRSIAELEAELGVELFARSPQGVELTEDGDRFIAGAVRILGDVESLISEFPSADGPLSGTLRIGVCPAGNTLYVRRPVRRLAAEHPDAHIAVYPDSVEALCPRLIYGELDLIVGSSRYLEQWRELDVRRLKRLHSVCVLRRDHPLAGLSRVEELDVLRYPAVLPLSVDPSHSDLAARHIEYGLPPFHPQYATDDGEMIFQIVRVTDGYFPLMTLYPDAVAADERYLTLRDVIRFPEHYMSIVLPPNRKGTRLAAVFEELFAESLNDERAYNRSRGNTALR